MKSNNINQAWTQTQKYKYSNLNNKDQLLFQELADTSTDIGLITETWLTNTQEDNAWVNQSALQQNSYRTLLHNRPGDHCGRGCLI